MAETRDDLVRIDVAGVAHPVGETARVRMQGREGMFHIMPSPPHLLFMRQDGPESRACLLSGEIRHAGALCDAASFVGQSGHRGELVVIDRGAQRSVYFDGGHVVGARSSVASERLGEILCQLGVLDPLQLVDCQTTAASDHLRLGEAAVQHGFVTRDHLFELVATQTQEIFYAALLVGSGAFYFLEGFDEAELAARHQLSVATLVRDGVRRMHEERFFRARIPSSLHVPVALSSAAPPADADLKQVHGAMDGVRSVADLGHVLGLGEFDVTRLVFQLVLAGSVTIRPPRLGPRAAVEIYNGAVALLLRELDAIDQGDVVRQQLAARATTSSLGPVLQGAGPSDDGGLDATRVAENISQRRDAWAVEEALGGWLHEHASYALFLARPHLRRAHQRAGDGTPASRVSQLVSGMLEPLAPRPLLDPSRTG
jgi:hypothetical protein